MTSTPVIAGFYPDPSVCRVGDDFYLVTSSFEYRPGVPLFTSRDLVAWTPVGSILRRTSQLIPTAGAASRGIFAPTIRHHGGRYWMVTTHFEEIMRGQLIVWADSPEGPWSDAVFVEGAVGIDPDLAWDDQGVCHLTWAAHGIMSVPIDPESGAMMGEPRPLWSGTGMASPEGPHLYRIGDFWYLLIAEGGTERGHAVSIARAPSIDGPWEPAPTNPILSHRSSDHPVQNTGHADLVELADGSWAMVHLGTRPRGVTPKFHTNGRETFVVGIDWIDGWPVVDESRFTVTDADHSFADDFDAADLNERWIAVGDFPQSFCRIERGGVTLARDARKSAPLLATRARDLEWTAEAILTPGLGSCRFIVRIDPRHWYGFEVTPDAIEGRLSIGPSTSCVGRLAREDSEVVHLRIAARAPVQTGILTPPAPDLISLSVIPADGSAEIDFGEFDGRYLSTEVAGGFTGRVIGIEVLEGEVSVHRVSYESVHTTDAAAG